MERNNFSMLRLYVSLAIVVVLAIVSAGCAGKDFNEDKAREIVESQPVRLDGEQASLNNAQIDCGVRSDLWERPVEASPGHTSARLTAEARALKFSDG